MKRIKIAFIHWKLVCGGAEKALLDLVTLLDKNRFDITVFAIFGNGEWEERFRQTGVRVVSSYSGINKYRNILERVQNIIKSRKIAYSLSHKGKNLLKKCTNSTFDIVVAYHIGADFSDTVFCGNAKTIKYIHGDVKSNEYLKKELDIDRNVFTQYDKIICVSEQVKNSFCELTGAKSNTVTLYNPLNSQEIFTQAMEKTEIDLSEPYICAVGRLVTIKGFVRLISIHRRLLDKGLKIRLIIVGEGEEREKIQQMIQKEDTGDYVTLTGYTSNPYPYIKNAKFLVCSSYSEGLPVSSMESLCLGVPVVSSYPGVRELFNGEQCGIVTENNDDESLFVAIYKMLSDHDFYMKAKDNAMKRSRAFSKEAMIQKVEQEYIRLLDSNMKENDISK